VRSWRTDPTGQDDWRGIGIITRHLGRPGQRRGFVSGAGALIEVEARDGLGFGRGVCARLVEVGIGGEAKSLLPWRVRGPAEPRHANQANSAQIAAADDLIELLG
jgi:hypothetical protein